MDTLGAYDSDSDESKTVERQRVDGAGARFSRDGGHALPSPVVTLDETSTASASMLFWPTDYLKLQRPSPNATTDITAAATSQWNHNASHIKFEGSAHYADYLRKQPGFFSTDKLTAMSDVKAPIEAWERIDQLMLKEEQARLQQND